MGSHVVAFLIADSRPFLVAELRRQSPDVWSDEHRRARQRHCQSRQRCGQLRQPHTPSGQGDNTGQCQCDPAQRPQRCDATKQDALERILLRARVAAPIPEQR